MLKPGCQASELISLAITYHCTNPNNAPNGYFDSFFSPRYGFTTTFRNATGP
jgi:hypothetical protein